MKKRNLIIITVLVIIGLIFSVYLMLSPLFNKSPDPLEPEKIYCTPEQKSAQVCPEYYSATCGWFNQSIQCFKYPCAQTFDNPCFACANPTVDYYTMEECPK